VLFTVLMMFTVHNFIRYIINQERYRNKGIFLMLFYVFAFVCQLMVTIELYM
jgi:predicted nucleic acid-binding Zn ribbon protein